MDVFILPASVVVGVLSLYGLTLAMYGDIQSFLNAWWEWINSILSFEVLTGGAFPPLRLAYSMLLAFALIWAEHRVIRDLLS